MNMMLFEEIKVMKLKGIIFLGGLDINKIGNCFVIFEYYDEFNVLIFGICFGY